MYTIKANYSSPNHSNEIISISKGASLDQLTEAITIMKTDLNKYLTTVMLDNNEGTETLPTGEDDEDDEEDHNSEEEEETANSHIDKQPKKQKTGP